MRKIHKISWVYTRICANGSKVVVELPFLVYWVEKKFIFDCTKFSYSTMKIELDRLQDMSIQSWWKTFITCLIACTLY